MRARACAHEYSINAANKGAGDSECDLELQAKRAMFEQTEEGWNQAPGV